MKWSRLSASLKRIKWRNKYKQTKICELLIWLIYLTGNAEAFKEDGNVEFKKKRYDIAVDNYTAGIKIKCPDKTLNAVLYSNRAAAQFYKRKSPSYQDLWYFQIVVHVHVLMHGSRFRNFNRKASPATIFLKFTQSLYLDWAPVYECMFVRPKIQSPLTPVCLRSLCHRVVAQALSY